MHVLPTDGDPARRRRNRYQHAVAALTGLAAAGSLTATGWLAGEAAHTWQNPDAAGTGTGNGAQDRSRPVPAGSGDDREDERPRILVRERPTRTRVSTRYVTPAAPIGGGGSVRSTPTHAPQAVPPAPSSGS
jgi:hypothetical protein